MPPRFFKSQRDFRAWLDKNHADADELVVGFYKKSSGRGGITYQEALDEALAYGWIDGVRKSVDAERWTIRFTARRPGSIWSVVNTKRVEELIKLRRMRPPGLKVFETRDKGKTRKYSFEQGRVALDAASEASLKANKRAAAFFNEQPPGYRKVVMHWVMSAKKEETRARRLARLIERCANGIRIDFMKPMRTR
jgi:uncharacterized protein YdeI (YjbR/CyaY-like superfamily)